MYGRMVDDCREKSTTSESLKAGEALSPTDASAKCFETGLQCIY